MVLFVVACSPPSERRTVPHRGPIPANEPADGGTAALTIGAQHTIAVDRGACVRTRDATLACWGWALPGTRALGTAPTSTSFTSIAGVARADRGLCMWSLAGAVTCLDSTATLIPIAGLTDVVEVEGHHPVCARRRDDSVACWHAYPRDSQVAHAPTELPIRDAVELAVGYQAGCVRSSAGDVRCWSGTSRDHEHVHARGAISIAIVDAPIGTQASPAFGVALLADGTLVGWDLATSAPRPMPRLPAGAQRIVSEGRAICVLGSGVACVDIDAPERPAEPIPELDAAVDLALGDEVSCAQLRDGTAACWGRRGWLGDGEPELTRVATDVPTIDNAAQLVALDGTACVRRTSGTVACWGDRLVRTGDRFAIDSTPVDVHDITGAIDIAVGSGVACALGRDAKVRCWGMRDGERPQAWPVPRLVRTLAGVDDLFPIDGDICGTRRGRTRCLASKPAATIRASWRGQVARRFYRCERHTHGIRCRYEYGGRDGYHEAGADDMLGNVRDARDLLIQSSLRRWVVRGDGQVVGIDDGADPLALPLDDVLALGGVIPDGHSAEYPEAEICGLRETGRVACWDATGKLREVAGIEDAVEIASSGPTSCVRRKSGRVSCWGERDYLGTGARSVRTTPRVVPGVAL